MNKNLQLEIHISSNSLSFSFDELFLELEKMMNEDGYGKTKLGLSKMRCKNCLKTITTFLDHFQLKKRSYSCELEQVIPVGIWIRPSWKKIRKDIQKANHPNKKLIFKPIANTLITDEELGLNVGLKHLSYHQQRCVWHFLRDFGNHVYIRSDDESKEGAQPLF